MKTRSIEKQSRLRNAAAGILLSALASAGLCAANDVIEVGRSYRFSQAQQSTRVFQIALPQACEFTINISGWKSTYDWGADYDRLYLYNSEGGVVHSGQFSSPGDPFAAHMFQGSTTLVYRTGQAGIYLIHLHSGELDPGAQQSYDLSVTATYCQDAREPNDSRQTASPITLGSAVQAFQWKRTNTSAVHGDEDWYQIKLPSPGKFRIELVNWIATYDWGADYDRFFVHDAAGRNIGGADQDGDGGYYSWMMGGGTPDKPVVIEMNLATGGTYFLRFHSGAGTSTSPYRFTTSFTRAKDSFEPNDDFATAKPILKQDVWHNACAWRSQDQTMNVKGDEDYYCFHAASPGEYTVQLEKWMGIYDWGADYDRLYVHDSKRQSIASGAISWMMGAGPITFNVPAAGKYYIQLHCGNGYSLEGYRIKLTGNLLGPDIAVEQPLRYNLTDGKDAGAFGKARVGKPGKSKTYTIRNKGVTTLKIARILKSGPAAKNFVVSKPNRSSLAPGQSTTFKVTFNPQVRGELSAAIRIYSNDKDENPFDIRLLGTGVK